MGLKKISLKNVLKTNLKWAEDVAKDSEEDLIRIIFIKTKQLRKSDKADVSTTCIERFSNERRKINTKVITPIEIKIGAPIEFKAITCNLVKARVKSRVQGAIGFGSYWLKNWREIFQLVT